MWKARDTVMDRLVAVAVPRESALDEAGCEQFLRDARNTAPLRHENIARVYEAGREPATGTIYIISEFIDGLTLDDWLTGQQPTPREAAALCRQVAEALHAAHQQGVFHRDLKPSNIMLDRTGKPYVIDFGLARRQNDVTVTVQGRILGTVAYMPPEQARGDAHLADARSDIYSLGVVLFKLLTGELPFRGNPRMLIHQILTEDAPTPRKFNANVPKDLETICLKCLEKEPHKRFATASDLADELARYERGEPIQSRPITRLERGWRWCRRNPVITALSTTAVALLATVAVVSSVAYVREKDLVEQRDRSINEKIGLITEKSALVERNAGLLRRSEVQRDELRLQLARSTFAHGLTEYEAGRHVNSDRDFLRTASLVQPAKKWLQAVQKMEWDPTLGTETAFPEEVFWHQAVRQVAWDRANRRGRSFVGLESHHEGFDRAAFSPDGQQIVTIGQGKTARVWDAQTGAPVGNPIRHGTYIDSAAFSPDGHRVIMVSYDGFVKVWDARTAAPLGGWWRLGEGKSVISPDGHWGVTVTRDGTAIVWDFESIALLDKQLRRGNSIEDDARVTLDYETIAPLVKQIHHRNSIESVAFSPDGERIVTASADKTAQVWGVRTGVVEGEPMRHEEVLNRAVFSPDGEQVVTTTGYKTSRLWNTRTEVPFGEPIRHGNSVSSAAFSPDGQRIVTADFDKAQQWDARTGVPIGEPMRHADHVISAAFSPDGLQIVTAGMDKTARVWDARTGALVGEPLQHESEVGTAEFSSDGHRILTVSWRNKVRVWDALTVAPIDNPMRHETDIQSVAFSPDGGRIVTRCWNMAQLWDARTGAPVGEPMRHSWRITSVAFSRHGQKIVTASLDDTARVWDGWTAEPISESMQHDDGVNSAAFNHDGELVVTASSDKTARVWNANGTPRGEPMRHASGVTFAAFLQDGERVITVSSDNTWRVWYTWNGKQADEPIRLGESVKSAALSRNGQALLTASGDNTAQLWDRRTGAKFGEPMRHETEINTIAFSPTGHRVVTSSDDKTARLWDAHTGAPLGEPMRHDGDVNSAAFSPDGHRVVTSSDDKSARLWDAHTGAPLGEPIRHRESVNSAEFNWDGRRLVTATKRTARIWDVEQHLPPAERVREHLELVTRLRSHDQGTVSNMTIDEWQRRRTELNQRDPDWWRRHWQLADERALRHHVHQARDAEEHKEWYAAAFHLGWLRKKQPDDPTLAPRYEQALSHLNAAQVAILTGRPFPPVPIDPRPAEAEIPPGSQR